jgi:hypothetical protein
VHCKTNVQMQILVASGALCRERVLQLFVELQSFESVCARSKVKRRVVQRVDLTHYGRLCLSLKFRCLGTVFGSFRAKRVSASSCIQDSGKCFGQCSISFLHSFSSHTVSCDKSMKSSSAIYRSTAVEGPQTQPSNHPTFHLFFLN